MNGPLHEKQGTSISELNRPRSHNPKWFFKIPTQTRQRHKTPDKKTEGKKTAGKEREWNNERRAMKTEPERKRMGKIELGSTSNASMNTGACITNTICPKRPLLGSSLDVRLPSMQSNGHKHPPAIMRVGPSILLPISTFFLCSCPFPKSYICMFSALSVSLPSSSNSSAVCPKELIPAWGASADKPLHLLRYNETTDVHQERRRQHPQLASLPVVGMHRLKTHNYKPNFFELIVVSCFVAVSNKWGG